MRGIVSLIAFVAPFVCGGCVGSTIHPAGNGRAYVVKGSIFGSDVYSCEAPDGHPACWKTMEEKE